VTYVLVGAAGFFIGLAAHDLAVQSLTEGSRLRPFLGTCPRCGQPRGWLRSTCPTCERRVGREIVITAATTLAALAFARTLGPSWELIPYLAFLLLTTALVVTDLDAYRIVDRLNLPGTIVVAAALAVTAFALGEGDALLRGIEGAAAYFVGASVLFLLARGRGFGAGDVKLAPQLGLFTAYLGWGVLGWAVFATAMIGGLIALVMIVGGAANRRSELPYGPPMVLGAWAAIAMVGVGAIPVPS